MQDIIFLIALPTDPQMSFAAHDTRIQPVCALQAMYALYCICMQLCPGIGVIR